MHILLTDWKMKGYSEEEKKCVSYEKILTLESTNPGNLKSWNG